MIRVLLTLLSLTGPEPTLPGVAWVELDGYRLSPNALYADPRPVGRMRIAARLANGATVTLLLKDPLVREISLDLSEMIGAPCVYKWTCIASTVFGDLDKDNDADQADFGFIQRCISGPGIRMTDECMAADLDRDVDVDRDDVALFQKRMTGAR